MPITLSYHNKKPSEFSEVLMIQINPAERPKYKPGADNVLLNQA